MACSHKIGSLYAFGGYDWRVLDVQGRQALLLSSAVLEKRAYHKDKVNISWEQCALRQYLNNDFYDKLPDSDKDRIAQRTIPNREHPWFGTEGGNDTSDKIFLLSIKEALQYLGDGNLARQEMSAEEKQYLGSFGWMKDNVPDWFEKAGYPKSSFFIDFHGNAKRVAKDSSGTDSWWWLRSPGLLGSAAVSVFAAGNVNMAGSGTYLDEGGVRPALWLNL